MKIIFETKINPKKGPEFDVKIEEQQRVTLPELLMLYYALNDTQHQIRKTIRHGLEKPKNHDKDVKGIYR